MLQLRFLTVDPHQVELARRYWQFDETTGSFADLNAEITAAFEGGGLMVAGHLAAACLAHEDAEPCPRCGQPAWVFATREEYLAYYRSRCSRGPSAPTRLCPCCATGAGADG